jgi:hypothetical protein
MNVNDIELEKLRLQTERFHILMETIAKIATIGGWVIAIYLIMNGLGTIVLANPDAILALSKVVESMRVNEILGWLGACLAGGGWMHERKGKKRANKLNSELRKQLESKDPHRSTSGLDDNGHTPK